MPLSHAELSEGLAQLRSVHRAAVNAIDAEYQGSVSWMQGIVQALQTGKITKRNAFPITPARPEQVRESFRQGRNLSHVWLSDSGCSVNTSAQSHSMLESNEAELSSSLGHHKLYSRKRTNNEVIEGEVPLSKFTCLDSPGSRSGHLQSSNKQLSSTRQSKRLPKNHADEPPTAPTRQSKRVSQRQAEAKKCQTLLEQSQTQDQRLRISAVQEEPEAGFSQAEGGDETFVKASADSTFVKAAPDSTFVKAAADSTFIKTPAGSKIVKATPDSTFMKATPDSTFMKATPDSTFRNAAGNAGGEDVKVKQESAVKVRGAGSQTATVRAARKSLTRAKKIVNNPLCGMNKLTSYGGLFRSTRARTASQDLGKSESLLAELGLSNSRQRLRTVSSENKLMNVIKNPPMVPFITKPAVPPPICSEEKRKDNLKRIKLRAMEATKKKEELIKFRTAEKTRAREEKRQRVLSCRAEIEHDRAQRCLRQDRDCKSKTLAWEAEQEEKQLENQRRDRFKQIAALNVRVEMSAAERAACEKVATERAACEKAATERAAFEKAAAQRAASEKAAAQRAASEKAAAQRAASEKAAAQRAAAEKAAAQRAAAEKAAAQRAACKKAAAESAASQNASAERGVAQNSTVPQGKVLNETYDLSTYDLTLAPEDRGPIPSQTEDNYGLDDVHTDDSSDDERKPKKVVPKWALEANRVPFLREQGDILNKQMAIFFGSKKSTPDLSKIFTSIDRRQLNRRSSAVWRTPPSNLCPKDF